MVKLTNGRKTPVCKVEIEDFLRNKGESISFIQEFVKLPQKGANHSCIIVKFMMIFVKIARKMRLFIANIRDFSLLRRNRGNSLILI